jgi:uncharacterized membrane protein YecN with MAPEG domain
MNQLPNPYAPPSPQADGDSSYGMPFAAASGLRREGELIVIPVLGAAFPPRCVVCNEAAVKRLKRNLFWHPPGYYALVFLGWIIYLVAAMIVRKRAQFEVGLCQEHVARRRNGMLLGWLGSILCFVGAIALAQKAPVVAIVLGLALVGCMVAGAIMARVVTAKRIDKQFAWLKFGQPFVDSIDA